MDIRPNPKNSLVRVVKLRNQVKAVSLIEIERAIHQQLRLAKGIFKKIIVFSAIERPDHTW
jgi:hypothetical protein